VLRDKIFWLITAIAILILLIGVQDGYDTNSASRFGTMDALVHDGTFFWDNSVFKGKTIDVVRFEGREISDKPPVFSVLFSGIYYGLTKIGVSFRVDAHQAAYWLNLIFAIIVHGLLLLFFSRFLIALQKETNFSRNTFLVVYASISFAYLGYGYASVLNNHSLGGSVALATFFYAYQASHSNKNHSQKTLYLLLSGFFSGLLPTLDYPSLFISLGIFGYLLLFGKKIVWYVLAALPPLIFHFWLNFKITGSLLPLYMDSQAFIYPGSYWNNPIAMDALDEPFWVYGLQSLIGHHGFFSVTPLLILAFSGLIKTVQLGSTSSSQLSAKEAWFVLFSVFTVILFYLVVPYRHNYGGLCVGPRYFIVLMPLCFLFLPYWIEKNRTPFAKRVFVFCVLISAFNTFNALQNPWQYSLWHKGLKVIGLGSVS
jgi:hypothetical protein